MWVSLFVSIVAVVGAFYGAWIYLDTMRVEIREMRSEMAAYSKIERTRDETWLTEDDEEFDRVIDSVGDIETRIAERFDGLEDAHGIMLTILAQQKKACLP